jgi:hypothetical protein
MNKYDDLDATFGCFLHSRSGRGSAVEASSVNSQVRQTGRAGKTAKSAPPTLVLKFPEKGRLRTFDALCTAVCYAEDVSAGSMSFYSHFWPTVEVVHYRRCRKPQVGEPWQSSKTLNFLKFAVRHTDLSDIRSPAAGDEYHRLDHRLEVAPAICRGAVKQGHQHTTMLPKCPEIQLKYLNVELEYYGVSF